MACLQRSSPALMEILLKIHNAKKPMEIDHHVYEFGSVEYHIKSSASDPHYAYLSISTPLLSQGSLPVNGLSPYTTDMVKGVCSDVVDIVEPPKEGYQLTLRLNFNTISQDKDSLKIISKISAMQAVILSSQLKEMLWSVNSRETSQGMYNKPVKLVYYPREPFYVIKQEPQKITTVFPMRFKEKSDVIIATTFFQELTDVGRSNEWDKAPICSWSPIPPPELRGEPFKDLSTNAGFVSFDITSRHIKGRRLDQTVWNLLNFYAYVKHHVKCTRSFIQRRMRRCLDSLVEVLQKENPEAEHTENVKENAGCRYVQKLIRLSRSRSIKRRCGDFTRNIKKVRFRIKIHGVQRFRRKWLRIPKFSSSLGYTKLE